MRKSRMGRPDRNVVSFVVRSAEVRRLADVFDQACRVGSSSDPVSSLFREVKIYPINREQITRAVLPAIFRSLDEILDGDVEPSPVTSAARALFHIRYDNGREVGARKDGRAMCERLEISGKHSDLTAQILDGVEPTSIDQVNWLSSNVFKLDSDKTESMSLMWAYGEAVRLGGMNAVNFFPADYARAVRLALVMEQLGKNDFVHSMFPLEESIEKLREGVNQLELGQVANDALNTAFEVERDDTSRVEDAWINFLGNHRRYDRAAEICANRARRFEDMAWKNQNSHLLRRACGEYWRAADIIKYASENYSVKSDGKLRLERLALSYMKDVSRVLAAEKSFGLRGLGRRHEVLVGKAWRQRAELAGRTDGQRVNGEGKSWCIGMRGIQASKSFGIRRGFATYTNALPGGLELAPIPGPNTAIGLTHQPFAVLKTRLNAG